MASKNLSFGSWHERLWRAIVSQASWSFSSSLLQLIVKFLFWPQSHMLSYKTHIIEIRVVLRSQWTKIKWNDVIRRIICNTNVNLSTTPKLVFHCPQVTGLMYQCIRLDLYTSNLNSISIKCLKYCFTNNLERIIRIRRSGCVQIYVWLIYKSTDPHKSINTQISTDKSSILY